MRFLGVILVGLVVFAGAAASATAADRVLSVKPSSGRCSHARRLAGTLLASRLDVDENTVKNY